MNKFGRPKGYKVKQETKDKISQKNLGHIVIQETKDKISQSSKGRISPCGMLGKKFSEATKKKMSDVKKGKIPLNVLRGEFSGEKNYNWGKDMSGKNNGRWIEDRTLLKRFNDTAKDRRSYAYSNWRHQIKIRDNFKCRMDNTDCSGRLEVHHILGYTEHPELRYIINNGITLCHFHHPRTRSEEANLSPYFKELVAELK